MIDFTGGGLADIWPDSSLPEIQSLSYAIQNAIRTVKEKADASRIYTSVDMLPESILDYLAVELRAMYYDQGLDVEQKQLLVQNALKWYAYAGTPATVEELMTVIFGKGKVSEWYEYGGAPYFFWLEVAIPKNGITAEQQRQIFENIKHCKNVRSWLEQVNYTHESHGNLKVGAYTAVLPWVEIWPGLVENLDFTAKIATSGTVITRRQLEVFPADGER